MSHHAVNKAVIRRMQRDGKPVVRVRVFCEDRQRWRQKTFPIDKLGKAVAWMEVQLRQLSLE